MSKNEKPVSDAERRARFLERILQIHRAQKREKKEQGEQKKNAR